MPFKFNLLFTALSFLTLPIQSQSIGDLNDEIYEHIKNLAYSDSSRLIELFKDIHKHPELAFQEFRTASIVAKELEQLGFTVMTEIGKTGVIGFLENGDGPVVMYRADMDAISVKESTGLPYASTVTAIGQDGTEVPVMHSCGHDAHVTWMLGIAKIMMAIKNHWKGTLVFLAQPAEEIGAGAKAMINDQKYKSSVPIPDFIIGMHAFPIETGYLINQAGVRMAGIKIFDITFHGLGGHSSTPHLAKDPIMMASTAVLEYQSIVNRSISTQSPHVISIGSFQSGTTNNVIPTEATLKVALRWLSEKDLTLMVDGINRVNNSIALANDLPDDLYPTVVNKGLGYPVVNDEWMVDKINTALFETIPNENVLRNQLVWMASEDFPELAMNIDEDIPNNFILVGIAKQSQINEAKQNGKEFPFTNHSPHFEVDINAVPFGTYVGCTAVFEMFRN